MPSPLVEAGFEAHCSMHTGAREHVEARGPMRSPTGAHPQEAPFEDKGDPHETRPATPTTPVAHTNAGPPMGSNCGLDANKKTPSAPPHMSTQPLQIAPEALRTLVLPHAEVRHHWTYVQVVMQHGRVDVHGTHLHRPRAGHCWVNMCTGRRLALTKPVVKRRWTCL